MNRILIILASFFSLSLSAATLSTSNGVSVLYINGQEAESKLGKNDLTIGNNQVIIRMDKKLGRGGSSEVFTSKPYVLNLNVTGEEITIAHPQARSLKEAEVAFQSDQPQWLIKQDGQVISYQQQVLEGKSGLFPYLGMDELVKTFNSERGISFNEDMNKGKTTASVQNQKISPVEVVDKMPNASQTANSLGNVEQLKSWYLKASTQERKEFRRWMIDQD